MDEIYTLEEVAGILKMTVRQMRKLIRAREIPAMVIGSRYRVSKEQLEKYLATRYTV